MDENTPSAHILYYMYMYLPVVYFDYCFSPRSPELRRPLPDVPCGAMLSPRLPLRFLP